MNRPKLAFTVLGLLSAAIVMTACAPLPAPAPAEPPTSTPWPPLVEASLVLAQRLAISPEAIAFVSSEPVQWSNACLDLPRSVEMCAEVITPGYRIVLEAGDRRYTLHTDESGSQVRLAEAEVSPALPEPVNAALRALAGKLGVAANRIQVVSVEAVEWSNACLDLPRSVEMCAEVITPGYRIVLEASGQQYTLHTDESGTQVRLNETAASAALPEAALAAVLALAEKLGVPADEIRVVSVEGVVWRDGCLELAGPDEMCTMALVSGYRVALEANGQQYTFHTNSTGSQVRMANMIRDASDAILEWRGQTSGGCVWARFAVDTIAFGPCDGQLQSRPLGNLGNRVAQLAAFVETYQSFSASTSAGTVVFTGEGAYPAAPSDQRMIAEWAAMVVAEAEANSGLR